MKEFKRILVCIEEPERDCRMLDYIGTIARPAETQDIHLLHVKVPAPPSDVPEELMVIEQIEVTPELMRKHAEQHYRGHGREEMIYEVINGQPLIEILRYAHEKEVDLVICGRANRDTPSEHRALMARRVARKATCSVLMLPENAEARISAIVTPVRDSECSANAMDAACRIARGVRGKVVCLNVFQVHAGYARIGSTLEQYEMALTAAARTEVERLLERVETQGVEVDRVFEPNLYESPEQVILGVLKDKGGDMIVIGARGRSGAAGVLLGSITEKLIQDSPAPVLAVKKKGECIGVLKALLLVAGQSG